MKLCPKLTRFILILGLSKKPIIKDTLKVQIIFAFLCVTENSLRK